MPAPKGHKKYGGGMKKGQKTKKTLEKEVAKKLYEKEMLKNIGGIIRAHLSLAEGTMIVMARNWVKDSKGKLHRTGEWKQINNPEEIEKLLNQEYSNSENNFYRIYTKDPNAKALVDILDRIFGKVRDEVDITTKGEKLEGNLLNVDLSKLDYETLRRLAAEANITKSGMRDKS